MKKLLLLLLAAASIYAQPNCTQTGVKCVGTGQTYTTIQAAANAAVPGDLVYVFDGTYAGFQVNTPLTGGTAAQPITFQAQSLNTIINTPGDSSGDGVNVENVGYVTVSGFTVTGLPRMGLRSALSTHVIFQNNHVTGNASDGILTGFATFLEVLNNEIDHNGTQGSDHNLYVGNSDTPYDGPIVRGNIIHDANAGNDIQLNGDCTTLDNNGYSDGEINGFLIEDNVIYNGHAHAIQLIDASSGTVRNNVMYGFSSGNPIQTGTQSGCNGGSNNNVIVNNTIDVPTLPGVRIVQPAVGNVLFNNLIVTNDSRPCVDDLTGQNCNDTNIINYVPGLNVNATTAATGVFNNYATHDYTLVSGSPGIDTGVSNVSSTWFAPKLDLLGNLRPAGAAVDNGAYEFGAVAAPVETGPPTVPTNLAIASMTAYQASLTWQASTDPVEVLGYYILRNGQFIGATQTPGFVDTTLVPGTPVSYMVASFNDVPFVSGMSNSVGATVPGIVGCVNTDNTFRNQMVPTELGGFTLEADVTPFGSTSANFGVVGISAASTTHFYDLSAFVAFGATGIQSYNNGAYSSDVVMAWVPGVSYHVRIVGSVNTQKYNVYITPAGGTQVTLATGYGFRAAATTLGNIVSENDTGTDAVCNMSMDGNAIKGMKLLNMIDAVTGSSQVARVGGTGQAVFGRPPLTQLKGNYVLTVNDVGKLFYYTGSSNITITVPNGLGASFEASFSQNGAGAIVFSGAPMHTLNGVSQTAGPGALAKFECSVADTCGLGGGVK